MHIKEVGYIVERLADRFRDLGGLMAAQEAAHKTALAELRASFNARTASDEHRLENLREEIIRLNEAHGGTMVERDALRAEVAALQERLRASIVRSDFAQMEVVRLKPQSPKHPVKVGEYVKHLTGFHTTPAGEVARVTLVDDDDPNWPEYEVVRSNGQKGRWSAKGCEPCDPPATHDTPEGKDLAESVIRDSRSRDINDGDLVEVVSNTGRNTWLADVGSVGTVTSIETINDSISVRLDDVPGKKNVLAGYVSLCDVRKVTT